MATSEQTGTPPGATGVPEPSLGELVGRMQEQMTRLVRDEMRLATAEMKEKGKAAGVAAGLFGGAGIVAVFGVGALVAAAIIALALVLPWWASALIVGAVLLAVAGVAALMGKERIGAVTPPAPREAMASTGADVRAVREGVRS